MLAEVLLGFFVIVVANDGWISLALPLGWAVLSVLSREVEGIYKSQILIHVSADVGVIDGDVSENLVGIDQESSSQ